MGSSHHQAADGETAAALLRWGLMRWDFIGEGTAPLLDSRSKTYMLKAEDWPPFFLA